MTQSGSSRRAEKSAKKIHIWFPSPLQGHSMLPEDRWVAKGLMESLQGPKFLFVWLVKTSGVKDRNGTGLDLARSGLKQAGTVLSYPGLDRPQQDLLCLIQLAFRSTEHLCSHSCLGPWETLHGVSLLGDVS